MANAVIGGMILSTALSLLVVPAFYVVTNRLTGCKGARSAEVAAAPEHAQ
jgi:hypothetical protein